MLADFRQFLLRGNLVDLAIAIVIGTAFAALVTSLVDDLIMPILAAIGGKPDFSDLTFSINDAIFRYGAFITALITFVIIAAVIFFFVVKPVGALLAKYDKEKEAEVDPQEALLGEIKGLLETQNQLLNK